MQKLKLSDLAEKLSAFSSKDILEKYGVAALVATGLNPEAEEDEDDEFGEDTKNVDFAPMSVGFDQRANTQEDGASEFMDQIWFFPKDFVNINLGREEENNIVIKENSISSNHCIFKWNNDKTKIVVLDVSATNGTWVNGLPLLPDNPYVLEGDETIMLGRYKFKFVYAEQIPTIAENFQI